MIGSGGCATNAIRDQTGVSGADSAPFSASHPPPHTPLSTLPHSLAQIDPTKKGVVIGSGGRTINAIRDQTGVSAIDMDDDGNIDIMGSSKEAVDMAAEYIDILVNDPPQGRIFRCEMCGEAGCRLLLGLSRKSEGGCGHGGRVY